MAAVLQGCLGVPETRICATKRSVDAEISTIAAIQWFAHAEQRRRPIFKICLSVFRSGPILALAAYQLCLGGPKTQICARSRSADAEISPLQVRRTEWNQYISIFWFKVGRLFLADSCGKNVCKSCYSSDEKKLQVVLVKRLAQLFKRTSIEFFFITIISLSTWNEATNILDQPLTMHGSGTIILNRFPLQ